MSEWISVEDKLPLDKNEVLLAEWYCGVNYGMVKAYHNGVWIIDKGSVDIFGDATIDIGFSPTHWMPLPPPKGI